MAWVWCEMVSLIWLIAFRSVITEASIANCDVRILREIEDDPIAV